MAENARIETPSEPEQRVRSETGIRTPPSGTTRVSPRAPTAPAAADYNLRILGPLVRYVTEKFGDDKLGDIATRAGLSRDGLTRQAGWMSWEQCEKFLEGVRGLVASEKDFDEACVYRVVESWGAFRYIAWALTPVAMYKTAVRANRTLCTVGEFSVSEINSRRVVVAFKSSKPESRLLCATRRGALSNVPAFFGLSSARLVERKCIAKGDAACEYDITWQEHRRWLPVAVGIAGGVGVSLIAHALSIDVDALLLFPPLLGASIGYLAEQARNDRATVANAEDANTALQTLMVEEADARREILALNERQREWDRAVESAHMSRIEAMQDVLKRAEEMQHQRENTLLGFSHDLRNPLMVLASAVDFLRDAGDALGDEGPELIEDVEASIEQMKRMLGDFVAAATSQQNLVRLSPQRLEASALTSSLTRRLRALAQGKPIIPSVIQTREAPEAINLDPLVFDRVTDNLLTNAAKYTERGSIVVEVTGSPGFLVVKVSDSGRGISESELEKIFTPGGSNKEARARDSFGVGLSVILQLLDQVGGSLEVMSAEGRGTTFWANFPTGFDTAVGPVPSAKDSDSSLSTGRALSSRVRIRKPPA